MKKLLKGIGYTLGAAVVAALLYVLITFPPVMAGMVAKTMCSCVYVSGRTPTSVQEKELQVFPGLANAAFTLHADSSVTAHILWHTSKAIYRKGLGCTLLAERSEHEIRAQKIRLAIPPSRNQDSVAWPSGNKITGTPVPGVNYTALNAAIARAFYDTIPEQPVHTSAVVVVYKNQLLGERYGEGYTRNSRLMGWSMTKSLTNAFIGIMVKEKRIAVDDKAPISHWQNDDRKMISIHDLLKASSGLDWSESYFIPTSHFHNMFTKSDDKGGYAASLSLKHKPGTYFKYSSGVTNILSSIMRQVLGDSLYYSYPYAQLFYKIGMHSVVIEPDASGTYVGSSYSYATARDWARFGLLYLNDGMWDGERILPENWVKYSATPAPASPLHEYGAQWWLNGGNESNPDKKYFPGLPADAMIAEGFERQYVVVIPSHQLVVVRLGVTHNKNFKIEQLVNGVMAALPEK